MPLIVAGGSRVRAFILEEVSAHPGDLTALAVAHFRISRQAVHAQIARLTRAGLLVAQGRTRARRYAAAVLAEERFTIAPSEARAEDAVWRERVAPVLAGLPGNVLEIGQHGFGEVLRNAVEHAGAQRIEVRVVRTGGRVEMNVRDDGAGLLPRLARESGARDLREIGLEIVKGGLSTEASRGGRSLAFVARLFDSFVLYSDRHSLRREETHAGEAWSFRTHEGRARGTSIGLGLRVHSGKTLSRALEQQHEIRIPVRLAILDSEQLLSRSQATRLLARLESAERIVLDFAGVETIGPAFADEIFRAFAGGIEIVNASPAVEQAIRSARRLDARQPPARRTAT